MCNFRGWALKLTAALSSLSRITRQTRHGGRSRGSHTKAGGHSTGLGEAASRGKELRPLTAGQVGEGAHGSSSPSRPSDDSGPG